MRRHTSLQLARARTPLTCHAQVGRGQIAHDNCRSGETRRALYPAAGKKPASLAPDVLTAPEYFALTGKNVSPCSRRMVSQCHGCYRTLGVRVYPGTALYGDQGPASRVLVLGQCAGRGGDRRPVVGAVRAFRRASADGASAALPLVVRPTLRCRVGRVAAADHHFPDRRIEIRQDGQASRSDQCLS